MAALDSSMPFRRADAVRAGLTDAALRSRRYRQLFRGVHVQATTLPTLLVRVHGALLAAPTGAIVSHQTAATLWGGVVPPSPDVHVLVRHSARCVIDGIQTHRSDAAVLVGQRSGLRVTSPETTFAQLSVSLTLVDLVVLGDSLVNARVTSPARLVAFATTYAGRGGRLARRAAGLVRTGVGSPMETKLRLLVVLAGMPEPVVDHHIVDMGGRVRWRLDLAYPEVKLALEYDGAYHDEVVQHGADLLRREALEADGWTFVVVVRRHLHAQPDQVVARAERAARSAGLVLPSHLSDEWQRYFPGRAGGN